MAKSARGRVNPANRSVRSGGKSGEFSRARDVNKMGSSKGSTTAATHSTVRGSAHKPAPFNGSNVYGIMTGGSSKKNSGSAPNADKGNRTFGSGGVKGTPSSVNKSRGTRRGR